MIKKKLNELLETINKEKKNLKSQTPISVKVSPDLQNEEIKSICEVLLKK